MCCQSFWKRIVPFALALTLGLLAANVLRMEISVNKVQENPAPLKSKSYSGLSGSDTGIGCGECDGVGNGPSGGFSDKPTKTAESGPVVRLKILSKPHPRYTDAARQNNVQGTVTLRIVFTAEGTIGSISPVTELPDGLTEQAIIAARQIKFEPPTRNGVPYSIVKTISYSFTIY